MKALSNFKIPKRKNMQEATMSDELITTNPGVSTNNKVIGPQLIKRARTMRFDKGGIGQQLVLAGFHQMSIDDRLKVAEELESVETQEAPDARNNNWTHWWRSIKNQKPYAKWGPSFANQLLTMFPKPKNSLVGPAPCFK